MKKPSPKAERRLRILEQVKKMLEMTVERGCTEAEAAEAAALVQDLVLKYALTVEELTTQVASGDAKVGKFIYDLKNSYAIPQQSFTWNILHSLEQGFSVRAIRTGKTYNSTAKLMIIGFREDADAFFTLYEWLFDNMYRAEVYAYRQRKGTLRENASRWMHYKSFCEGYAHSLTEILEAKFAAMKVREHAIVVYKDSLVLEVVESMKLKNVSGKATELCADAYKAGRQMGTQAPPEKSEVLGGGAA